MNARPLPADRDLGEIVRHRWRGTFAVDRWGYDADLAGLFAPLAALRWQVTVDGAGNLPADGPAVVVVDQRVGLSEPWVLLQGIARATGRVVRVAAAPDLPLIGPVARRFGAVLRHPDEVASLLRAGAVVGLLADPTLLGDAVGGVDPALLVPALRHGAAVVPAAAHGSELGRRWRLTLGAPVEPAAAGPGDAAVDLANRVRAAIDDLRNQPAAGRRPGRA